ncbi:MAG: hypothetical protein LIR46_07870 [Bacteroidota bacterium]|nr:hypothetical protein [Bacteroidota bacterium]
MILIKIDGMYFNIERVDGISLGNTAGETHIFVGGSEQPFIVERNIDDVAERMEMAQKRYLEEQK